MRGKRSHVVSTIAALALALGVTLSGSPAAAQNFGSTGWAFSVEAGPRTFARAPAVEGYLYNGGLSYVTNVRLRVEVLGADGKAVAAASGWMIGDLASHGRGYFMVPVPTAGATYRVTVTSFDVISGGP
jgi:hypothetical protein